MVKQKHNLSGTEALIRYISSHGNLSISAFMEYALFDPVYGYYTTAHPFGKQGDFITAPEISQIFGELIGIWCVLTWEQMGKPSPCALVEIGPGQGTLLADLLRGTTHVEGFHEAISLHLIERSPALADQQRTRLTALHPRLTWHTNCTTLPALPTLLIANELFDALAIDQWITHHHYWYERQIGLNPTGQLIFTHSSDPIAVSHRPENTILETSPFIASLMWKITSHLRRYSGAALIIDYGYEGPAYGDTLQAVKAHCPTPILQDIGQQDITAHVNFSSLSSIAQDAGLHCSSIIPQGTFLEYLGIDTRLQQLLAHATPDQKSLLKSSTHRLIDPAQMGTLFKVLAVSYPFTSLFTGYI